MHALFTLYYEGTIIFLHYVLKVLLTKICKTATRFFIYCRFYQLLHQQILFFKFLELHSALFEKKIFVTNFPFSSDYLKPPPPQQPKSTNRDKSFMSMLHNLSRFLKIIMLWKNQNSRSELMLQPNYNPRVVIFYKPSHNVYLWQKNFYRNHLIQYRHLQMARISFVLVGKMFYQTKAY